MLCLRLITSRERSGVFRKVCQEIPQRNGEFIVESVSKSTRVPLEESQSSGSDSLVVPATEAAFPHDYALPGSNNVYSTHSASTYADMVQSGIDLVRAGDIFQVNLAQQFSVAGSYDPLQLYEISRVCNPAPFAGYLDFGNAAIVSMSPERFIKVSRGSVSMHPIKVRVAFFLGRKQIFTRVLTCSRVKRIGLKMS